MTDDECLIRTKALLGGEKLDKIRQSSVMIIGLGAVGGYALEMIARLGFGKIFAVDFDVFEKSNLNRQILALNSTLGMKKCDVAKMRVGEINKKIEVIGIDKKIGQDNLSFILECKPDFVIDAIDDIPSKSALIRFLVNHQLMFISSMGAARKIDVSKIITTTLKNTSYCPVARKLRDNLKNQIDLNLVPCVYSTEKSSPYEGMLGSVALVPAVVGICLASWVLDKVE